MRFNHRPWRACLFLAALFTLCGTLDSRLLLAGGASSSADPRTSINTYLASLPDLELPPASQTIVSRSEPWSYGFGDDRQTCHTENVREQGSLEQFAAFGQRADVLWPGSILQGRSLVSNQLAPVSLDHGPQTIVVTAFVPGNRTTTVGAELDKPTLQSVTDRVNSLVFDNPGEHQPASMAFSSAVFFNERHGAQAISASFSSLAADMSAYLSTRDYARRSHVVVKFVQQYYTVAVPPPASPSRFFSRRVKLADVQAQSSQTAGPNPIVFVNTVTYGRAAYLFLSSTESSEELKAAVDATFSGLVASGSLSGSMAQQRVVREAEAQTFVLGGDAAAGARLVARGVDGLAEWLQSGATFSRQSPGAVIAFSTRYLRPDYRIAGAAFVTDYSRRDCVRTPEQITAIKRSYHVDDDKDRGNDHRFSVRQGGLELASENWTGGDIVWRTGGTYDGPWLSVTLPVSSCSRLQLITEQRGNNGEMNGNAWVTAKTNAGRTLALVNGARFSLDDTASITLPVSCP
jgi:thiol-activated cytolysin